MAQYCRYCTALVTGNGTYCTTKKKEMADSTAKRPNKCQVFELNPMDAFGENPRDYAPRRQYKQHNSHETGQLSLF
jgi:hypothetical protein